MPFKNANDLYEQRSYEYKKFGDYFAEKLYLKNSNKNTALVNVTIYYT